MILTIIPLIYISWSIIIYISCIIDIKRGLILRKYNQGRCSCRNKKAFYYSLDGCITWQLLAGQSKTNIGDPCRVHVGLEHDVTSPITGAYPYESFLVNYIALGQYPTSPVSADTAIVSPVSSVKELKSALAHVELNGGSGTIEVFYGPRGGGNPTTSYGSPTALSDGEVELITGTPIAGNIEWKYRITLQSGDGTTEPFVDSIVSLWE